MIEYTQKIRETAKRLLESKAVDCFIGYTQGSVPLVQRPTIITDAAQADTLVWDSNCALNLANYLPGRKDKVGILATGCASRNIQVHLQENQIKREQLVIVGVPCTGMIDHRAVRKLAAGREILSVVESGDSVTVTGDGFAETLKKADILQSNCATCQHRNPVDADETVAAPVAELECVNAYADVEAVEALDDAARWAKFENMFESCIRCYACRNACPLCYCPTCFVDESKPQWLGKSVDKTDTMTFHFLRAFHMAGRCTDCGSCERACPVDIPLRYLTKKLNKDAKAIYDFEAGVDPQSKPLLDVYKVNDLNDFIR
jgi:ferredoxin